jgi:hypothetical protein
MSKRKKRQKQTATNPMQVQNQLNFLKQRRIPVTIQHRSGRQVHDYLTIQEIERVRTTGAFA